MPNGNGARRVGIEGPRAVRRECAPERLAPGAVAITGEAIPVPSPDAALTHPSFCYQYTTNNTRLAPLFGRPRILVGLPAGFAIEGSYVPPVSVSRARHHRQPRSVANAIDFTWTR